jgi:tRNA (mo5U34)-methyltransferase
MDADGVEALRASVGEVVWHHRIDLGNGVVTPGLAASEQIADDLFPAFDGRSVLDIGAWDGGYSFLAERSGASRVVALDHYAWGVDLRARTAYWDECRARGELPDHSRDETDFWRDSLPGRRGFDIAKRALGSAVEPVVADFMTANLDALGVFDIALHLGVLYHLKEPLTALERLRRVTREVAVIETEAVWIPGFEDEPLSVFFPGDELAHDFGNWYAPNAAALVAWCRAAGFTRVDVVQGPPQFVPRHPVRRIRWRLAGNGRRTQPYRIVVHAHPE